MNMPRFTAEASVYRPAASYFSAQPFPRDGVALIQPQFRSGVRRQCGRCVDGTRSCVVWGYECTAVKGAPGSKALGIPPSPGHLRCQLEIFREMEEAC